MIIIEGADRVGKSTLAQKIVKELNQLGWPHIVQHLGRPPESWRPEAVSMHSRLMSPYVVRDRLYMSEPVYCSVCPGRTPLLSPKDTAQLNQLSKSYCGHTIVVAADEVVLRCRLSAKEDELYGVDSVLAVNRAFSEIAATCEWAGHHFPVDASETCLREWPDVAKCGLRSYTMRLRKMFPYHNARIWGGT